MKYYRDPNQSQLWPGEIWRNEGMASVARNNEDFILEVLDVIRRLIRTGGLLTVDVVRSMVTIRPTHHNAWGAACNIAYRLGLWRIVGREHSRRPQAHARSIPICIANDDGATG